MFRICWRYFLLQNFPEWEIKRINVQINRWEVAASIYCGTRERVNGELLFFTVV